MDEFNNNNIPSAPRGDEHTEPQQPVNETTPVGSETPQAEPLVNDTPQAQQTAAQTEASTPYQTPVQQL